MSETAVPPAARDGGSVAGRYWWLAARYFHPRRRPASIAMLVAIAVCVVAQVAVQLRINVWQGAFFDALERRDVETFVRQIWIFALLAAASVAASVLLLDLKMRLQLEWRRWLAARLTDSWLNEGRHYELTFVDGNHDNPDQRIAEDVRLSVEIMVDFAAGLASALLMFVCFVGVLWSLSSDLTLPIAGGVTIPGYMVWAALTYATLGTAVTSWVGRPLAGLSASRYGAEAEYRFHLMRARENAEGIALMRGEPDERALLVRGFESLAEAWRALRRGTCRLAWLTSGYSLTGIIFPALVAAPMYFVGEMTLGGLMQAVAAMVHVQTALSWFVDNFPRISDWRASAGRVVQLSDAIAEIAADAAADQEDRIVVLESDRPELVLRRLDIAFPDGRVVISGVDATIAPGEKVLIVGESGTGKSTLMRAIAGVWPWGRGEIALPRGARTMFMPQRPYLPLGTLAGALAYPLAADAFPVDAYRAVLERCGLGELAARLEEAERWDQVLSGGEQQRLAFARLLLHQPEWVFLDEATAALDEAGQADLMRLFREELAATAVISIGHRPGLEAMHDRVMTLMRGESAARLVRGSQRRRDTRDRRSGAGRLHRALLDRLRAIARRQWAQRAAPRVDEE